MKIPYYRSLLFMVALVNLCFGQVETSKNFSQSIGGSDLVIEMTAIPSGKFTMGSPTSEEKRNTDEGPAHTVTLDEFWISTYEITWELYNLFVYRAIDSIETRSKATDVHLAVDAIAGATVPYVDMSLGMGTRAGLPVGNVTHYAASQFCKWLSAKTGYFYRLPTEAEWEYSARAGTETAYYFGDSAQELDNYGWYYKNSDGTYHQVGTKEPNAWGLYDMQGNVAEWTLDNYVPEAFKNRPETTASPFIVGTNGDSHSVRGGSYDDDAEFVRSATRLGSTENWKMRDPQFPKSKWWNTDAPFVGFRIVRDPNVPNETELNRYWGG